MILYNNFKLYIQITDAIKFPQIASDPYMISYFSENSNFFEDYPKLHILRNDIKNIVTTFTKIPYTTIDNTLKKNLREKYKLYLFSSNQKISLNQNFILDLSTYLNKVDLMFKPLTYRGRSGLLIKDTVLSTFTLYPNNYKKILLYVIDLNKPVKQFINSKLYLLWELLKSENFNFDDMIFATIKEGSIRYRLVVKNRDFDIQRITNLFRNIKHEDLFVDNSEIINTTANNIVDKVINKDPTIIQPNNVDNVKKTVFNFLSKDKKTLENIIDKDISDNTSKNIVIASVMSNINGDISKSKSYAKNIPKNEKKLEIKKIDKNFVDEMLVAKKEKSTSELIDIKIADIDKLIDNKTPEHLFEKRKKDFKINLQKDIESCFGVLEKKDIPLKIYKIEIIENSSKNNEIEKSDISTIKAILVDKNNKKHTILIDIPKIDEHGTFRINGNKKCLVNQIVLCPITFPKIYDSKFESAYSQFHIHSKHLRNDIFLEIFIGSYILPLGLLCFYAFGMDESLNKYGISKTLSNKNIKNTYSMKIDNNMFIILTPNDPNNDMQNQFCRSLSRIDFSKFGVSTENFGSKDYFTKILIAMTGRVNSTYLIQSMIDNIVDPIVKQILINKHQPYEIDGIIHYMCEKVVTGIKQARNDISNQRIKNSEVISHLILKQILAAHTEYKEKYLSGNKQAKLEISRKKLMSEFLQTEIVTEMEFANPIEEMSSMTRVTPVGKKVGGIPDKGAITDEGRDIHPSMYGNIDPLDTPEGGNVGIVQHLTVDAYITSSRGLFLDKKYEDGENTGLLSTSSVMTPFIESCDGPRVMFAANQARQAVPLKNPEPPIIQTGYESLLTNTLSDSFIKKSKCDGKVTNVSETHITIKCNNNKNDIIDISPVHLKSGSGKNTLSIFNPTIKIGDIVKQNKIIAEGSCVKDGTISMGKNLCMAFMIYQGYNFEDGIVISESLQKSEKLTSLHGIIEEVVIDESDRILEIANLGDVTKKGDILIRKTLGKIEDLIGIDPDENTDISSGQLIKKSQGGVIKDIEVFSNMSLQKYPSIKQLAERTNKRYNVSEDENFMIRGTKITGILIKFYIEQELHIGIGDKMTNRYGAKGIISLIEKDENMPVTPWGDTVEIITNPIGIINRMNMGQLFELYMGLISRFLSIKILKLNNRIHVTDLLTKVYTILDPDPKKEFSKRFISNFVKLSDKNYNEFLIQTKKSRFVNIIVSQFKSPKRQDIMSALKFLGLKNGYKLKLPEYNTTTLNDVPVGYEYWLKLEHIGSEKIASRSTGPMIGKVLQPTAGKKKMGGQRIGELDTYALLSYGCNNLLAELFGPLSDDQLTKNEIISEIIQSGNGYYKPPSDSPSKNLLSAYMTALCLEKR